MSDIILCCRFSFFALAFRHSIFLQGLVIVPLQKTGKRKRALEFLNQLAQRCLCTKQNLIHRKKTQNVWRKLILRDMFFGCLFVCPHFDRAFCSYYFVTNFGQNRPY